MTTAYVLLNVKPDSELETIQQIKGIIKTENQALRFEVQGVYGVYDIVLKVESEGVDDVKNILEKTRKTAKITSTITMLVIETQEV